MQSYVDVLLREIAATRQLPGGPLQTVFFGGGVSGVRTTISEALDPGNLNPHHAAPLSRHHFSRQEPQSFLPQVAISHHQAISAVPRPPQFSFTV